MYLHRYGLKRKAFQITAEPEFLWLGDKHREALALLRHGVHANHGIFVLTGQSGTGKTTLVKRLISEMNAGVALATLAGPDLSRKDFYDLLSESFEIKSGPGGRNEFDLQQPKALSARKQVLMIDNAHHLNQSLMEEIRWLSGTEGQRRRLNAVYLVGQPQLNGILSKPQNRDLAQRIAIRHCIEPLEEIHIAAYIEHRLEAAGCDRDIFSPSAIFVIYELTGGIPRLINSVCHRALLTGDARGSERIDDDIIRAGAAGLGLPIRTRRPKNAPIPADRSSRTPGALQNPMWVVSPEATPETVPETPPRRKAAFKWRYAVPVVLLGAYSAYHFNYLNAREEAARNDRPSGWWATGPPTKLDADAMPSSPAGQEEPSSFPLIEKITIRFDPNSNELDPKAYDPLDTVAILMAEHPERTLVVRGYTDSSGPVDLNMRISRLRAEAVKSYLIGKGVESEKIEIIAMGPKNPIASNDTPENRRRNRRVEIEFP